MMKRFFNDEIFFILFLALAASSAFDLRAIKNPLEEESSDHEASPVQGRIANGESAFIGQFPYQVGLSLRKKFILSYWCGGSLIAKNWVLTAAHCCQGASSVIVYLGATNRNKSETILKAKRDSIVIHEKWNPRRLINDIALIKIPSVTYGPLIQPVQLPHFASAYSNYYGEYAIASGWGLLGDSVNDTVNELQWARLQVVANPVCRRVYGSAPSSTICLRTTGGVSTCEGDSGGPLVLEDTKVQIGLTSYGFRFGCEKEKPVVFTRLTAFLPWIHFHTGVIAGEKSSYGL